MSCSSPKRVDSSAHVASPMQWSSCSSSTAGHQRRRRRRPAGASDRRRPRVGGSRRRSGRPVGRCRRAGPTRTPAPQRQATRRMTSSRSRSASVLPWRRRPAKGDHRLYSFGCRTSVRKMWSDALGPSGSSIASCSGEHSLVGQRAYAGRAGVGHDRSLATIGPARPTLSRAGRPPPRSRPHRRVEARPHRWPSGCGARRRPARRPAAGWHRRRRLAARRSRVGRPRSRAR